MMSKAQEDFSHCRLGGQMTSIYQASLLEGHFPQWKFSPSLASQIGQLKKRRQKQFLRESVKDLSLCLNQDWLKMDKVKLKMALGQQKKCGELQLVFHDQDGP